MATWTKSDKASGTVARGYRIGQRNPDTLPGAYSTSEGFNSNAEGSRRWRKHRRWAASISSVGAKY